MRRSSNSATPTNAAIDVRQQAVEAGRDLARLRRKGTGLAMAKTKTKTKTEPVIDTDRIDDAVLALLLLGQHNEYRVWKGFDWEAMNRLHEKGMISNPVGKAKSVVFSEEGLRRATELFEAMFTKQP